jgi:phage tail sheath gpL-like
MTVPFKQVPQNLLVPLFYAEIDPSRANTAAITQRALILGQMTSAGSYAASTPIQARSMADVKAGAGIGSMLAAMYAAYRANDQFGEAWVLPLADDAGGAAATGSIAFTGTATAAGTLSLYIAGTLVTANVTVGMTAVQAAAALRTAIAAVTDLPVTAATSTSTINITARHKGLAANDIDIRFNFLGTAGGEAMPAGLSVVITAMSGGTVNPSLTAALATLGDVTFDFIVSPYTDATSIAAIKALLSDISPGRWSWSMQAFGHCFIAKRDTLGNLATFGSAQNDQHLSVIGFNDSPSPNYCWAAAFAGAAAVSLRADAGLPLQTLTVAGILAPKLESRFGLFDRQMLLQSSISTWRVDANSTVVIENIITTYSTNAQGQADNSYLEIETLFLLAFVIRRLSGAITAKFSRVKLASDATRVRAGRNVVTPKVIRAELIAQYRQLEDEGFVQNGDAFAQQVVVEKDAQNPNRVNVLWPGTLINQLRIFATLIQFRLN